MGKDFKFIRLYRVFRAQGVSNKFFCRIHHEDMTVFQNPRKIVKPRKTGLRRILRIYNEIEVAAWGPKRVADSQTVRPEKQTVRHSDSQTRKADNQTLRQSDPKSRQSDSQTVRPEEQRQTVRPGRQTVRQSDSHTRHADSQTVRPGMQTVRLSCLPGLSVRLSDCLRAGCDCLIV